MADKKYISKINKEGNDLYIKDTEAREAVNSKADKTSFGASGTNHSSGLVPDPGATQGSTKYLREDGTWQTPPDNNTWRPVSDSVSSTSSSDAASSKAVKTAYDLAASKTANTGTVTSVAIKMNGTTKGTVTTSGTIDLGTVITAHQDISGKVDNTTTVNGHALSGNVSVTKSDVGLGNVGNFKAVSTVASQDLSDTEKANARANIGAGTSSFSGSYNDLSNKPTIPAAAANGTYTVKTLVGSTTTNVSDFTANQSSADDVTFVQGSNVTITPDATNRKITIAAKDTTYSSKSAESGGTDVSLVTTGEKAAWNNKQDALIFNTTPSSSNKVATMSDVTVDYTSIDSEIDDINASVAANALLKTSQSLTASEKAQVKTNLDIPQELYSKTEVNGLVDTPHQNYVTVAATSSTTAATDVLPASGQSADTIYRVSNWDGSANSGAGAFSAASYSEYAWDDVSDPNKYVFLCVKSQIGEVFDITVYNNNTEYADLASALGTNGVNVPEILRKGGMSIKFVSSVENKYVQYRLISNTWSSTESDWQSLNADDKPTAGSENLVKSSGVFPVEKGLNDITDKVYLNQSQTSTIPNASINGVNGAIEANSNGYMVLVYKFDEVKLLKLTVLANYGTAILTDSLPAVGVSGNLIMSGVAAGNSLEVQLPTDKYLCIMYKNSNNYSVKVENERYVLSGIDNVPTENSQNLVKSGGVYEGIEEAKVDAIKETTKDIFIYPQSFFKDNLVEGKYVTTDGIYEYADSCYYHFSRNNDNYVFVLPKEIPFSNVNPVIVFYNGSTPIEGQLQYNSGKVGTWLCVQIPSGCTDIYINFQKSKPDAFIVTTKFPIDEIKDDYSLVKLFDYTDVNLKSVFSNIIMFGYFKNDGTVRYSNNLLSTIPFRCSEGDIFRVENWLINYGTSTFSYTGGFFDENMEFVSPLIPSAPGETYDVEIPSGVKYISFILESNANREINSSFSVKKRKIGAQSPQLLTSIQEELNYWNDKVWVAFGDSMTQDAHTIKSRWKELVAQELGLTVYNCGIGGTCIGGDITDAMWKTNRIDSVKSYNPDIVTIQGGSNDCVHDVPIGTEAEFVKPLAQKDTTNFMGALSYIIETLQTWKTSLMIVICGTNMDREDDGAQYSTIDLTCRDYSDAMEVVAKYYSLPFVDWHGEMNINKCTIRHYTQDGVHWNALGGKVAASLVLSKIKEMSTSL